jgi:hypothetical protein
MDLFHCNEELDVVDSKTTATAGGTVGRDNEEIDPETLAAIVAAAAAFLGKRFQLLSVTDRGQASRWTRQGRASVQASHNVRQRKR